MANRPAANEQSGEPSVLREEAHITDLDLQRTEDQRRLHPRYGVDMDVTLGSDHNFYAGLVENLSAGGVFVATHSLKAIGERVELSIRLPETEALIKGTGVVRWVREYNVASDTHPGMGIQFVELEAGSEAAIQSFLSRREPLFFDD